MIVAGATVALTFRFAFSNVIDAFTNPVQPREVRGATPVALPGVFGVAHNAGDSREAVAKAVTRGANVVEIDVVSVHGRLVAAHDAPLPGIRLDAPPLEDIWQIAKRADAIEFDLKQSSPLFLDSLVAFIRTHRHPRLIAVSRSAQTLRALRRETPWAARFLSIANAFQLERVKIDGSLSGLIQGVSVRQDLLDAKTTRWLHERQLVVLAWVVDDAGRAQKLGSYGVDGIATNNRAIQRSLGHQRRPKVLATLTGAVTP